MTHAEAKEIIQRLKHLEKPMDDPSFQTELKLAVYSYKEAKGYLEGRKDALEGEEVKELVDLVEKLSVALNDHLGFRYYPNGVGDFVVLITRAEEALSKFRETVK